MPTPAARSRITQEISEVVRKQVQKELGCFLDHLERLGENLAKSLDDFVVQVKDERGRLADPSPKIEEPELQVNDRPTTADNAPTLRAERPYTQRFSSSFPDIGTSDPIDFSLPPLLDGKEEVVVELSVAVHKLTVSFDGTFERLTGRMEYTADWPDYRLERLELGAELPEKLWKPFSDTKGNLMARILPRNKVSTDIAIVYKPFLLGEDVQSQRVRGPWLRQVVSELAIDMPITDVTRLKGFPQDSVKLDFFFCCWHILEASLRQCIRFEVSSLSGAKGFEIVGTHGGPEWECDSAKISLASHRSPKGVKYSDFIVSIILQRCGHYYNWKVGMPLLASVLMACLLLVIAVETEDGISARLTGLAAVLFVIFQIQHTMAGKLPRSPVLTLIDKIANASIVAVVLVALYSAAAHCFWRVRNPKFMDVTNKAMLTQNRMMVSIADASIGSIVFLGFVSYASFKTRQKRDTSDDVRELRISDFPIAVDSTTRVQVPRICDNPEMRLNKKSSIVE